MINPPICSLCLPQIIGPFLQLCRIDSLRKLSQLLRFPTKITLQNPKSAYQHNTRTGYLVYLQRGIADCVTVTSSRRIGYLHEEIIVDIVIPQQTDANAQNSCAIIKNMMNS